MLFNYLKIAVRNLIRNRLFSFINIAGMSIGMAAFMLIFAYCWNALNYDNFHTGNSKPYRIIQKRKQVDKFDSNSARKISSPTISLRSWNLIPNASCPMPFFIRP